MRENRVAPSATPLAVGLTLTNMALVYFLTRDMYLVLMVLGITLMAKGIDWIGQIPRLRHHDLPSRKNVVKGIAAIVGGLFLFYWSLSQAFGPPF